MIICVKVFGAFLIFVKLSSYSNLITYMFVISLHVGHFITPFINRYYFCRYTIVTVARGNYNYTQGLHAKKTTLRSRITTVGRGGGSNKWGGVRNCSKIEYIEYIACRKAG